MGNDGAKKLRVSENHPIDPRLHARRRLISPPACAGHEGNSRRHDVIKLD